jgi:hypothetical protein
MTSCTKTGYAKRSEAMKTLHSMRRRLNEGKIPDTALPHQGTLAVYKCPVCKRFHIGHRRREGA